MPRVGRWRRLDPANPPDLACLLRASGQRHGENNGGHDAYEAADRVPHRLLRGVVHGCRELKVTVRVITVSHATDLPNTQADRPAETDRSSLSVGRDSRTRYSTSMKLSIDLSPAQAERLRLEAERLGLTPEDLARAAIADLLASAGEDFKAAAERVLKKNEELYRRLS
jgi:hypothetical protein